MKNILLLAVCLIPSALLAQIDVESYRQSVIDYSYTLKIADAKREYADQTYKAKQTASLPSLTLSGEFTEQINSTQGAKSWNFNLQPQLSQTIYGGGAIKAERDKAKLGYGIANADAANDLLEVSYNADYYFYNLASRGAYLDAIDQYVTIIEELRDVVALRYSEGYIAKGDLLMIETRLSEALYQRVALEEDYTIALQQFNSLRGEEAESSVELARVNVDKVELPARASIDELLMRRPDFLAATMAVEQAESSVKITRSAYNPKISIGVTGSWQPHSPNINGSTMVAGVVFAKLSAPIFHFRERGKAVAASAALHQSSRYSTMALLDAIALEESNTWAKIVDSRAQLDAAQRALSIGNENLEISTFAYSEGLTTILDVMQAQISWLQLYGNSIWSEFNFLTSVAAYRRIAALP